MTKLIQWLEDYTWTLTACIRAEWSNELDRPVPIGEFGSGQISFRTGQVTEVRKRGNEFFYANVGLLDAKEGTHFQVLGEPSAA